MRIHSTQVFTPDGFIEAVIELEDGIIRKVCPGSFECDLDVRDACIVPGFLDIHTHGAYGVDVNKASKEELLSWAKKLPEEGVTSFLPTTLTAPKEELLEALKAVKEAKGNEEGARILGIHMEGPFLNESYCGAQPKEAITKPDVSMLEEFVGVSEGLIKVMTVAPEKDEGHGFIKALRRHGIVPSIGHSGASYEECIKAKEDGAMSITHAFNAMSPFHHRNPGIVNFLLAERDFYSEIIGDGHHVDPSVMKYFFEARDEDHNILISDSLLIKGMKGDNITFGGARIVVEDGAAHLCNERRSLAGSILKINEGIKVLVDKAHVPLEKALKAATINPARLLKEDDHLGMIKEGYDADLVILDKDFRVLRTYVKGREVYKRT